MSNEMNNQAAQTMPERALAAWTGKHRTDAENRAFLAGYETCQSDANAASLSQTAGADVMTHFCNAIDNLNDMPVSEEWARKWTAKAEFLIGMGPDPGDQSLSDTPNQTPAASVSERAREWEEWNDGDSSFLSVADSDARYEVSFAIHEGHSGVWRAYFNPDTEREPIKETHLGTFASKERAKKECEDHCNRAGDYRDNDGGVPYVY